MTLPGPPSGEINIEVNVDTRKVEPKLEKDLHQAALEAEGSAKNDAGKVLGDALSQGIGENVRKHGDDIVKEVERGLKGKHVNLPNILPDATTLERDAENVADIVITTIKDTIAKNSSGGGGGGIFGFISDSFRDAVGSAFNVSGKSPLIALLIPAFGALGALILGAVDGIYALSTALLTLPSAIGGVAASFGILAVAWHGVFGALQGTLNAKSLKEYNDALKGLAPSAQEFVKVLDQGIKNLKFLGGYIQSVFFKAIDPGLVAKLIGDLYKAIQPGIGAATFSLGKVLNLLFAAFDNPSFTRFIKDLLPALSNWLDGLGPAVWALVRGFSSFGDALLPFLTQLGDMFNGALKDFGNWLHKLSTDENFKQWLKDMLPTIKQFGDLLKSAGDLLGSLLEGIRKNGGKELLDFLISTFEVLAGFFKSDLGQMAIHGLIDALIILTFMFAALVIVIGTVVSAFDIIRMSIEGAIDAVTTFFGWIGRKAEDLYNNFVAWLNKILDEAKGLPMQFINAIADLGTMLYNKGKAIIGNMIQGIKDSIPSLNDVLSFVASQIAQHLPSSPAKVGALSGKGAPYSRGQALVRDFARGVVNSVPSATQAISESVNSTNNIVFGPGAVRVQFEGVTPTTDQARMTGSAVGEGIVGQLSNRTAALSTRTL